MRAKILTCFTLCCCVHVAVAQDANYWSTPYSPAGFLVPGAVIAHNGDSGVFFYNPALLAGSRKNSVSVSGTVYNYDHYTINNALGAGKDLRSHGASIIPQMVSGTLALKGKRSVTFGYALLHVPVINFQASQQRDDKFNVLNDSYSPGDESFVGQANISSTIKETTGIVSAGFKMSPKFSVGLSAEVQLRKHVYNRSLTMRALYNAGGLFGEFANVQEAYIANYSHIGLRFKAGFAYDAGRHHLGLLISSPLVHLYGRGYIQSDFIISDLIVDNAADTLNLFANTRQEKLKARWKMPVSVALGYAFDYAKGKVYVAAEYFRKVDTYGVITPRNEVYIRPDDEPQNYTSELLRFKDVRRAVLNVGVGLSYSFNPQLTGLVGVYTDFRYADNDLDLKQNSGNGNAYNISYWSHLNSQIGVNIQRRKFNLRTGLLLTYASTNKYPQFVDFSQPHEDNFLAGQPGLTTATHFSAGFLFAYVHNL
ncbi:hypothetical protein [Chryseolinea lacunae]|uniref:DUF5723 domain-containing protein n=1 Tax=Chryseolinea lacunae TaxID=2801331 RepID=A0ABS1KKE8_9BACT|nr:hypothetical protein [Chryseolinea lacunae]MBL0739808.1 hypothetical protein [Chryseolinea lacunae]